MATQKYVDWLRNMSFEVNLALGRRLAITEAELSEAIPFGVYVELCENGDLKKRTLVTNVPMGVFEHLYRKNLRFRNAVKEIHMQKNQ